MSTYGNGVSWLLRALKTAGLDSLEGCPELQKGAVVLGRVTKAGLRIRALRKAIRSGEVKMDDPATKDLAGNLLEKLELFERRVSLGSKVKGVTKLVLHRNGSITAGT